MKMYETLDMGGMPIKNCPSTGEVVIQETEPTDPHVKWWVVPEKKEVVEVPEYDKEGNPTGGTITQTKITPVTLMYRLPDGTFKAIDSIAGAPGHDGTDGISPTVSMEDLLDDDGKKIGNGLTLDASTGKVSTQSLVIKKKKITLRIKNPELAKFDDASPTAKQDSAAIPSTDGTYYGKHYHRGNAINWFCDSLSSLGLPIAENIVSITTSFWESGTGIPNIDDDKGIYIMQFTPAPNVKITIPSSMKVTVTYIEEN